MLRKITLKKQSFFISNRSLSLRNFPKLLHDEVQYWTNLEERLGVKHAVIFHILMCTIVLDWIVRFSIYYLHIFGRFDYNRGLMSMDAQVLAEPALIILYTYFWLSKREKTFCLYLIYQWSRIILYVTFACYIIDVAIYEYSRHLFCALQANKLRETCETRNQYLVKTALLFWIVLAPLWYICNGSIYQYARNINFVAVEKER